MQMLNPQRYLCKTDDFWKLNALTTYNNIFQVIRFPLKSCSIYINCSSCVTSNHPLNCGWCHDKCTTSSECSNGWSPDSCVPQITSVSQNLYC